MEINEEVKTILNSSNLSPPLFTNILSSQPLYYPTNALNYINFMVIKTH